MITCHNINHKFKKSKFNLFIEQQTFEAKGITAFIGHNGSGKSTMLSLIAGIMKPTNGFIQYYDKDVFQMYEKIKNDIHLLSWDIALYNNITGEEQIQLVKSISPDWDTNVEENLRQELRIPLSQKILLLSHGEEAKLKLLISLCRKPKVLLIDEIANDLDTSTRKMIYKKLDQYSYDNEAIVFVATNIVTDMERYASQIVLIDKGKILLNESLDSIKLRFKKLILRQKENAIAKDPKILYHTKLEWDGQSGLLITNNFNENLITELLTHGIDCELMPYSLEEIITDYSGKKE